MKRIILGTAVFMFSDLSAAQSVQLIYGLHHAERVIQQKHAELFYIQANSFFNQKNAQHYQKQLQAKTHFPVTIKHKLIHKKRYYAVMIGPISSVSALKQTAIVLGSTSIVVPRVQRSAYVKTASRHLAKPTQHLTWPSLPSVNAGRIQSWVSESHWLLGVGLGAEYGSWPSSTNVPNGSAFPAPYKFDLYTTQARGNVMTEVSVGRRWTRQDHLLPAYSLNLLWQFSFDNNMGNTITQYSKPQFLNYSYKWKVQSNLFLAAAKLNLFNYKKLSPFINGGVGEALNLAHNYSETTLSGITARVSPAFKSNTSGQFAYQAGAGFDVTVTPQFFLSLGYNYQDLGQAASGYGLNTWAAQQLRLSSYKQNEFLIKLNYLFNNNQ